MNISEEQRVRGQEGKRETSLNTLSQRERVSGRVDFSLPEKLDYHASLAMTKAAFTLAEVLITLGIIGIVAAMTLPALVQHYRKVEYSSRLKKFYSSMNQAIRLSEVDNGSPADWNKVSTIYDDKGNIDYNANEEHTYNFFMKYLAPYIKYTKIEQGKIETDEDGNANGSNTTVYFADGSTARFWNGGCIDIKFDVNGNSKPNQFGRDIFVFPLCSNDIDPLYGCGKNKYFCAYWGGRMIPRTTFIDACKNGPYVCSGLLIIDGLEFKDDYPYKL
ncbi:type II secretion system protein [bacterium]|nr:type II secretion system protein [bacterium]